MKKQAFTLVELIVVITILAILATVWFVSFSWYLAWARDTNRIAQLKSMSDALELYRTKKDLPIPDDKVDIKIWTGSEEKTIAYQWYIGANVLETIEYTEKWLDPKDKTYFWYYLTKNKKHFQLISFLEEPSEYELAKNNVLNSSFADNSWRYPRVQWKKLWILTDNENTLINDVSNIGSDWYVNIEYTTEDLTAHIDNEVQYKDLEQLAWVAWLWGIYSSCKSYLDKHSELAWKDWYYLLFSNEWEIFPTYCNMTLDWWGWTLLLKADGNNTNFYYDSDYWENDEVLNEYSTDLNWIEYKSRLFSTMNFQEINLVLDTAWTINNQSLPFVSNSLKKTFSSWFQDFPITKEDWMTLVPWSRMQENCNMWWINVDTWPRKSRIWFISNQENDCLTTDSTIWIGLTPHAWNDASVWNNCSHACVGWNTLIKSLWYIYVR